MPLLSMLGWEKSIHTWVDGAVCLSVDDEDEQDNESAG